MNTTMKNYYDKQRDSTLAQIEYLYTEKDVTFRGFRHHGKGGRVGEQVKMIGGAYNKTLAKENGKNNGNGKNKVNEKYDPTKLINWENSSTDAERFSQDQYGTNGKRYSRETSFANYSKKKEIRMAAKKAARISNKVTNGLKVENSC